MPIAASSPRPGIYIDGVLHTALSQDLLGFTIEDAVSSPARCLARFANTGGNGNQASGYKYFALDDFDFGRRLTVWQGVPPTTLVRLFEGRIVLIEGVYAAAGTPEVLVQAEDRLWDLRMTRRTRVFEHMTDADMIQSVAADHGLDASVDLTGSQITHTHTAQLHQSDYAFLFDRITAAGAQMWIEQNTLVVTDAAQAGDPTELVYGDGLVHFRVRADIRRQATVSGVSGWDVYGKQAIGASASDDDVPSADMDASSGGRTLEAAFGHKRHAIVDVVPASEDEAASLAVAYHRQQSAEFIIGHGVAVGAPALRAGRAIVLQGVGPLFNGGYHITRVRHLFDLEHGLRAEFEVRRARLGAKGHDSKPRETAHANEDPRRAEDSGLRPRDSASSDRLGTGRRTKEA